METKLDLGKDSIAKIFISYAIPSILGMLAMSLAGVIDGIFIGRYVGTNGLAAVNLVYPLAAFALGVSIMIGVGGSTIATTEMGAGKKKDANETFTLTLLLIVLFALFVTIVGTIFMNQLIGLLGANEQIESDVYQYLSVIILFFVFFMLTFIFDAFIRSDGSPLFSVLSLIASAFINIALDYIFVARFSWGLKGAALATGISQFAAFLLLSVYLLSGKSKYKLAKPSFSRIKIKNMMYNGSSELVNEMSAGKSTYVFNLVLMARLGSIGVAAYSIIGYGAMIVSMIMFGIAQAVQPAISFNLGSQNVERIRKFLKTALLTNVIIGIVMFAAMNIYVESLASVFVHNDKELISLTIEINRYFSFSFLLSGSNMVMSMYFTATQKAKESVMIALSRSFIALMTGLMILPQFLGDKGVWSSVLFAEFATIILVLILYKRNSSDKRILLSSLT